MWDRGNVYRGLVWKPEGKRPLRRPRHRWKDNINMDLQEVGCWGTDWIEMAQNADSWRALVNAVMNLRVPENVGNFLTSWKSVSFSRRTVFHGGSNVPLWKFTIVIWHFLNFLVFFSRYPIWERASSPLFCLYVAFHSNSCQEKELLRAGCAERNKANTAVQFWPLLSLP